MRLREEAAEGQGCLRGEVVAGEQMGARLDLLRTRPGRRILNRFG
jgi:hypothetical protein